MNEDKSVLNLLLNWCVNQKRHGKYRSIIVAKIFLKRQMEIMSEVGDLLYVKCKYVIFKSGHGQIIIKM